MARPSNPYGDTFGGHIIYFKPTPWTQPPKSQTQHPKSETLQDTTPWTATLNPKPWTLTLA